ncbi:Na/Pi cotransporter family protein [Lachnobacterium bovis]|uniref:Na/Pi cotransporter family protein n=1 Tax=Lachnobacterium bovis TaxID=140626 RepID=UPI0003B44423|nr:Na/Pi cotransporter family protein [Lachnobacterium bovis]
MDIFGVLTLLGGLALFLFGMSIMGDSLTKLSGGKLEQILEKLTSTRLSAVLLGTAVTAVIQSSSATTVMVVGFVNSGIMKLSQAVGIIMGANVGTTVTSWMLSLTGIEGSSMVMKLLKPSSFAPILAAIGIVLMMFSKKEKSKDIGLILLGFTVLMTGMESMSNAVKPLADDERFTHLLLLFKNPVFGIAAGAVLTAVIQSSSASVGILQALCKTGAVSYGAAMPIIMGQNIGTCVTAIISSIGAKKNAKRAAAIHLYFNLIGTTLFLIVFYGINAIVRFDFIDKSVNAAGIAIVHSLFNIASVVVLFPFANLLVKMAKMTIKVEDEHASNEITMLDERFLEQPGVAMEMSKKEAIRMAELTKEAIVKAMSVLFNYDKKVAEQVIELEQKIDKYEDAIGSYLVKLSARDLSQNDSRSMSVILHTIGDFERISDHAVNIVESAKEIEDRELEFSKKALKEITIFSEAVLDIVDRSVEAFINEDYEMAKKVEPLEQVIDSLNIDAKQHHIKRLRKGKCTMELGLVLEDIITNFERVADHCSNIGICMIQINDDGYETHEYLEIIKQERYPWFEEEYKELSKKYSLSKDKDSDKKKKKNKKNDKSSKDKDKNSKDKKKEKKKNKKNKKKD